MGGQNLYINIIVFLLSLLTYYLWLKPTMPYDIFKQATEPIMQQYTKKWYMVLGIFLMIIILTQFLVNIYSITSTCGGAISDNVVFTGMITVFPWVFIFGILVVVLAIFPGLTAIFSNVFGYFYVSNGANTLLTKLLIDKDIQKSIDTSTMDETTKYNFEKTADLIIKICGNTGILINQITPANFNTYIKLLEPLMKPSLKAWPNQVTKDQLIGQLYELVKTRENVGEFCWYIYTGLFIIFFIQLKISTKACSFNSQTQQKNYQEFLKKEQTAIDEKNKLNTTQYTL